MATPDKDKVITTSVINLDCGDDADLLQLDSRPGHYSGSLPLRVFPPVKADVVASNGEITTDNVIRQFYVPGELIRFTGSRTARTRFPIEGDFDYLHLGLEFDEEGNELSGVTLEVKNKQVVASQDLYGIFRVMYSTQYREYFWDYVDYSEPEDLALGQVIAYYDGAIATLDISLEVVTSSHWTNYYTVYSKYVADGGDASEEAEPDNQTSWEFPPNFPTSNTYPGLGVEGPDKNSHQILERVHLLGTINKAGIQRPEYFSIHKLQPYIGNANYKPELFVRWAGAPDDGEFNDAFTMASQNEAINYINSKFLGYTINFP